MGYETRERISALKELGRAERAAGELEAARSLYEEAVLLCRQEGHPVLLAHTLRHLGDVQREAGRLVAAERCCEEALALYRREVGRRPLEVADALRSTALLREARGDAEGAREVWAEARTLYRDAGAPSAVDECAEHLTTAGS